MTANHPEPLRALDAQRFETVKILKSLANAHRYLAELKGVSASIANQNILVSTLGMQEAKDSSAIENIVTTHDELYRDALMEKGTGSPAAKEVLRYRQALSVGFDAVRGSGTLTTNHILDIQAALEKNNAGFRKLPGTTLRNDRKEIVYTPPAPDRIPDMMSEFEHFINTADFDADPLVRMALAHHQLKSFNPSTTGTDERGASSTCCTL